MARRPQIAAAIGGVDSLRHSYHDLLSIAYVMIVARLVAVGQEAHRGYLMGLNAAAMALAMIVGPFLGGMSMNILDLRAPMQLR